MCVCVFVQAGGRVFPKTGKNGTIFGILVGINWYLWGLSLVPMVRNAIGGFGII